MVKFIKTFFVFLLISGVLFSCKHDKTTTKAIVYAVTTSGAPLVGAQITFYVDTTANPGKKLIPGLPETRITDEAGKVEKSFENGVIVDLYGVKDTLKAKSFIVLEPGEEKTKQLTLK